MATNSQSMSTFSAALKRYYPPNAWKVLCFDGQPLLSMLPKKEDWVGDSYTVPIGYAAPQGRSKTFSTALANKQYAKQAAFLVTSVSDFITPSIKTEVILASGDPLGAFVKAMTSEIERAMQQFQRATALAIYGDQSASLGTVGAPSGATFAMQNADDILRIEVGQVLVTSAALNGVLDAGSVTVAQVDRDNNLVTCTGTVTAGIASFAAGRYLYNQGDASNNTGVLGAAGLLSWLPAATTAGTLFGVNRDLDRQRLGGVYIDLSGANALSPLETINRLLTRIVKYAGKNTPPDYVFVPFTFWETLTNDLLGKVQPTTLKPDGMASGFPSLTLNTAAGVVTIVPDISCPSQYIFALKLNTWKLISRRSVPFIMDLDGQSVLRESADDAIECRIQAYYNLICEMPGVNGLAKIA